MSVQHVKRTNGSTGDLVICDVCGARMFDEVIDWGTWDWSWQQVYVDVEDEYMVKHLCDRCRTKVVWCKECQKFHYKNGTHKVKCSRCGRLFTAFVGKSDPICANCQSGEDHGRWWLEALGNHHNEPET